MASQTTRVADRIRELILHAPAGGLFTEATATVIEVANDGQAGFKMVIPKRALAGAREGDTEPRFFEVRVVELNP
jgi:hypothetical protein